jgi:hypothetical protein
MHTLHPESAEQPARRDLTSAKATHVPETFRANRRSLVQDSERRFAAQTMCTDAIDRSRMIPMMTDLDAVNRSMAHACQPIISLEISERPAEENPKQANCVFTAHSPMKNRAEMHRI